jgi:hypothetical protein
MFYYFSALSDLASHGLINFIDTKAKCRYQKITSTGTLRQVFIRVYRLEIQSVMLAFSIQLCELLSLSPSLWFSSSPLPHPCVNKNTIHYTMYTFLVYSV